MIYNLGDVCEIVRGGSPRPIMDFLTDTPDGVNWLKIGDVREYDKYFKKTAERISIEGTLHSREVTEGDLILSNSMSFGRAYITLIDGYIHDGWLRIRNNPNLINREYLYYFLSSELAQNQFKAFANGSVVNNLKSETVKAVVIDIPSLSEQLSVAATLSCLDDKIELNNRIIANLETQTQSIFKSWFVDFEPFQDGEFEDSELGLIPKGWRVSNLLEIANYLNGLAMQNFRPEVNDEGLPVLKIKELRQGFCDDSSDRCTCKLESKYIVHDGDVIFSWSGSLLIDLWCSGDCGLNQHLFKVTSKEYQKWFYYMWTKHHLDVFVSLAADKATTMGHIKREALENALIVIPNAHVIKEANAIFEPLIDSIILKRIENRKIALVRDTLLPKLMSGEIEVPVEG